MRSTTPQIYHNLELRGLDSIVNWSAAFRVVFGSNIRYRLGVNRHSILSEKEPRGTTAGSIAGKTGCHHVRLPWLKSALIWQSPCFGIQRGSYDWSSPVFCVTLHWSSPVFCVYIEVHQCFAQMRCRSCYRNLFMFACFQLWSTCVASPKLFKAETLDMAALRNLCLSWQHDGMIHWHVQCWHSLSSTVVSCGDLFPLHLKRRHTALITDGADIDSLKLEAQPPAECFVLNGACTLRHERNTTSSDREDTVAKYTRREKWTRVAQRPPPCSASSINCDTFGALEEDRAEKDDSMPTADDGGIWC